MTILILLAFAITIFRLADRLDRNYREKWIEVENESIRLLEAGLSREFILIGTEALRRVGRITMTAAAAFGILLSSPLLFLGTAAALFALPGAFLSFYRARRRRRFHAQLDVALPHVVSILHAGHTFERALETLSLNHPAPLNQEFALVLKERTLGRSLDDSLDALRGRIQSRDLDIVVQAVSLSHRLGSNLAEIIERVSDTIRARSVLADRLQSLTAQGRAQGWIATLMPVLLLLVLNFLAPGYVAPLYQTEMGRNLLVASALALALGGFWIHRIAREEPMP